MLQCFGYSHGYAAVLERACGIYSFVFDEDFAAAAHSLA